MTRLVCGCMQTMSTLLVKNADDFQDLINTLCKRINVNSLLVNSKKSNELAVPTQFDTKM